VEGTRTVESIEWVGLRLPRVVERKGFVLFTNAIVRVPGSNFADGLTSVDLGVPEYEKALEQWEAYCVALSVCGLIITRLEADLGHPDSTFVEDTAVLTPHGAMLTRPGAVSRLGEVDAIAGTVRGFYPMAAQIATPGTLDGGDICEAGRHFFLGLSHRTTEDGARQLAEHLANEGYTSSCVDVRGMASILHLKSGISYIGPGPAGEETLVVMEEMADWPEFAGYDLLRVSAGESYAANCVRVNDRVLVAKGYPLLLAELTRRGFDPLVLDMSEFQKMDGGLSCLSLRF
jgi:dimethylargininase